MKQSLPLALGLSFGLVVSMPILGANNANAAMQVSTATATSPGSDAMTVKYVKKHKKHKKHVTKHMMPKNAY